MHKHPKTSMVLLVVALAFAVGTTAIGQDQFRDRLTTRVVAEAEEEGAGNNLSFPVIWGEASSQMTLRGIAGSPATLNGVFVTVGSENWYEQKDPDNEWQADNYVVSAPPMGVSLVDWGDNLEARAWTINSVVRCETVLYQTLVEPMAAFTMLQLYGSGVGEMWGTTGQTYESDLATVYSGCARFTIQKLHDGASSLAWNPALDEWTGDVNAPIFSGVVGAGAEGPGSYSAEINIAGKVIYG